MKRREFIAGLGSAAARAQQVRPPVVGFVSPESADHDYNVISFTL